MYKKVKHTDRQKIEQNHQRTIIILDVLIGFLIFCLIWIGVNIFQNFLLNDREYVYNCSVAEIHPDFTPAMREACREQLKRK